MRQTPAEQVVLLRSTQKDWIKHRDEGLKLYLSLYPKAEREARRLQFLGDVTAARIGGARAMGISRKLVVLVDASALSFSAFRGWSRNSPY